MTCVRRARATPRASALAPPDRASEFAPAPVAPRRRRRVAQIAAPGVRVELRPASSSLARRGAILPGLFFLARKPGAGIPRLRQRTRTRQRKERVGRKNSLAHSENEGR